jgi:hypothetical protein
MIASSLQRVWAIPDRISGTAHTGEQNELSRPLSESSFSLLPNCRGSADDAEADLHGAVTGRAGLVALVVQDRRLVQFRPEQELSDEVGRAARLGSGAVGHDLVEDLVLRADHLHVRGVDRLVVGGTRASDESVDPVDRAVGERRGAAGLGHDGLDGSLAGATGGDLLPGGDHPLDGQATQAGEEFAESGHKDHLHFANTFG